MCLLNILHFHFFFNASELLVDYLFNVWKILICLMIICQTASKNLLELQHQGFLFCFQLFFTPGQSLFKLSCSFCHSFFYFLNNFVNFFEAELLPSTLNARKFIAVDAVNINANEATKHFSFYFLPFDWFYFEVIENKLSEIDNLLNEFRPQLLEFHVIQILKGFFIKQRSHKCIALSISECLLNRLPDFVADIGICWLAIQTILQIFFRSQRLFVFVEQCQRKIS